MRFFFLCFIFAFSCAVFAHENSEPVWGPCETRLLNEEDLLNYRIIHEISETVRTIGEMPGSHGGKLIILEKKPGKYSWYSQFSIFQGADQGDPRGISHTLGVELAYFFGVREISSDRMTIPDAAEINGAIKKLNKNLLSLGYKPIPIHYYEQSIRNHKDLLFLKMFAEEKSLPFNDSGSLLVHDVSYHLSSVLLTEELLQPIVDRYKWAIKFYEFIRDNADVRFFQQMNRAEYLSHLVARVDAGLGNLQPFFNFRSRKLSMNKNASFSVLGPDGFLLEKAWGTVSVYSTSKREMLDYFIGDLFFKVKAADSLESEWSELYSRFIDEQKISKEDLNTPYKITIPEVYTGLANRIEELKQALRLLQSKEVKP